MPTSYDELPQVYNNPKMIRMVESALLVQAEAIRAEVDDGTPAQKIRKGWADRMFQRPNRISPSVTVSLVMANRNLDRDVLENVTDTQVQTHVDNAINEIVLRRVDF